MSGSAGNPRDATATDAAGTAAAADVGSLPPPMSRLVEPSAALSALVGRELAPGHRVFVLGTAALALCVALWLVFARVDVVATAPGQLVPVATLQVVQPVEGSVVRELLVQEGDRVDAGAVVARLERRAVDADAHRVEQDIATRRLELRRVGAALGERAFATEPADPPEVAARVAAKLDAELRAHAAALASERATRVRLDEELRAAREVERKLERTVPLAAEKSRMYAALAREGFAGRGMAIDHEREHAERVGELAAQRHTVASLDAALRQSDARLVQLDADRVRGWRAERVQLGAELAQLEDEARKHAVRAEQVELRAPRAGIVKDLATHSTGSVLGAGTVLMTLVPTDSPLEAEVWIAHDDAGFVTTGQSVQVKVATFPFQRYGMVAGTVRQVSPDATATDTPVGPTGARRDASEPRLAGGGYRARVALADTTLVSSSQGTRHTLAPGMQVVAEVHLGTRSVLDYLLSPIAKTVHEAGRER
jgi:HlyD family secretion protein